VRYAIYIGGDKGLTLVRCVFDSSLHAAVALPPGKDVLVFIGWET
jgi:hypothetical protein